MNPFVHSIVKGSEKAPGNNRGTMSKMLKSLQMSLPYGIQQRESRFINTPSRETTDQLARRSDNIFMSKRMPTSSTLLWLGMNFPLFMLRKFLFFQGVALSLSHGYHHAPLKGT